MLSFPSSQRIFAAISPIDFRKSHDGLHAIVKHALKLNPSDGSVFVFFNRRRDRVKLLVWDGNGFWLFYKRLEAGTFRALPTTRSSRIEMQRAQLSMILEGIDLDKGRMRKHFVEGVRLSARDDGSGGSQQSDRASA